jgi:hypothetical protein
MQKSRERFRWVDYPRAGAVAGRCHVHRCGLASVANRLCPRHNATWIANLNQPPMPARYTDAAKPKDDAQDVNELLKEAERALNEVAALPMQSASDADVMREQHEEAEDVLKSTHAHKQHLQAPSALEIKRIEKLYAPLIARYVEIALVSRERLSEYEQQRASADHPRNSLAAPKHPTVVKRSGKHKAAHRDSTASHRRGRPRKDES